jgi:hypothetical protein
MNIADELERLRDSGALNEEISRQGSSVGRRLRPVRRVLNQLRRSQETVVAAFAVVGAYTGTIGYGVAFCLFLACRLRYLCTA